MKKIIIFTFGLLYCFLFATSYAAESNTERIEKGSYLKPSKLTQLSTEYFNPLNHNYLTFQDSLSREERLAKLPGYKLPKRALFFSAVIPGTGELYTKSYLKAAAFFLVEVGAWTIYGAYNKKGNDKEDEYEAYADEKWNPRKWYNWYSNIDSTNQEKMTHAGHMVELLEPLLTGEGEAKKTQQYYEMIGNELAIADDYMKMRADSNDLFERAKTGTTIAMLNHLLSAIDAAWTAKRHNNQLLEARLEVEQIYYANHLQPVLSLKIRW